MMEEPSREKILQILDDWGWDLVEDEDAFVTAVRAEFARRMAKVTETYRQRHQAKIIEDAIKNCYNPIWYEACRGQDLDRQHKAFEQLYTYLAPFAFHNARQDERLTEEVLQAALEKIWKKLDTILDPQKFQTWVVKIVQHEAWALLKKAAREPTETDLSPPSTKDGSLEDTTTNSPLEAGTPLGGPSGGNDMSTDMRLAESEAMLRRCLADYPQYQEVMVKLFLEEKGTQEVAEELGIKVNYVHVIVNRARKVLRGCEEFLGWLEH